MRLPGGLGLAGLACLLVAAALLVLQRGPGNFGEVPEGAPYGAVVTSGPPAGVFLPDGRKVTLESMATSPAGTLEPPPAVAHAGWWREGAAIGADTGTIVLAGHVDAAAQGIGAFEQLWRARPGQRVRLVSRSGREVGYRITGTRVYPRTTALPVDVFEPGGAPRLALITCAGDFDPRTRRYSDTLVVYAVPAAA